MSRELLLRFFRSDHFNQDPFLAVAYLARYSNHIGIHHFLCSRLKRFSYQEIEFYIPQLCHLIVSISDAESVALEEYVIQLCEQNAHGALIAFWLFQTHLHDLSSTPQSNAFKTCRRLYNKVQHIVFGSAQKTKLEKLQENTLPTILLASLVMGGVATPFLGQFAGPVAIAQARKSPKSDLTISETPLPSPGIKRSKTVGSTSSRQRKERKALSVNPNPTAVRSSPSSPRTKTQSLDQTSPNAMSSGTLKTLQRRASLLKEDRLSVLTSPINSSSMPDLRLHNAQTMPLSVPLHKEKHRHRKHHGHHPKSPTSPAALTVSQKSHMLRTNYFHNQTQFLLALEDISNRLIPTPKQARLSALRAELALLNEDLPAEVDIPLICPSTTIKDEDRSAYTKYHRVVRINPAEATVLNSAERVPYLLMVEVLLDDFDFDPANEDNEALLSSLISEGGGGRRRIFDITDASRTRHAQPTAQDEGVDSVFEPVQGDIGASPLISEFDRDPTPRTSVEPASTTTPTTLTLPRLSSGATTLSTSTVVTPRTSGPYLSRANSPAHGKRGGPHSPLRTEQPDLSALATHMRTAAHMLAQLDASSSKRPKDEVAAIKAKIIASMQVLEEQSFFPEENTGPTFETMIDASNNARSSTDDLEDGLKSPSLRAPGEAGAARMENDQKTAGVERKADKDDPSAATFGEEWKTKRERIRKSSPYGLYKNWDLLSVIVKTGGDLRQEAFACQLIQFCNRIWQNAGVPVWVRTMRILVTGESSGLIETITNGVSLHSLKRSLTLASIQSGQNPRNKFATLKDHFLKTFGEESSKTYEGAVDAFTKSLAAASMICYILQLKDRHNGNILVDNEGHIIHIDFGFLLSNSPGSLGFEAAPFKLTQEYVDVLGGPTSPHFDEFRQLCKKSFQALRKDADNLVMLVELMGKESAMPCFGSGVAQAVAQLRARFQLQLSEAEAETFVDTDLIGKSMGSYYTRMYDAFQYRTQGIY